jgi:hypothetical protein
MPKSAARWTRRLIALLPLLFTAWAGAESQSASTDSATTASSIRVWLSAGGGAGRYFETAPAGVIRTSATVSVRRAVIFVRDVHAFEGIDGHTSFDETSVLAGYRSAGRYLYVIPAIGVSHAHWKDDLPCHFGSCQNLEAQGYELDSHALAYDLGLHAGRWIGGVSLNLGGVIGPPKLRLFTAVLSLQLGWFGR